MAVFSVFRCLLALALIAGVASKEVTPIDKVITLIEDLKSEVESDGKAEAAAYGKFACFCKDTTSDKSKSVKTGKDDIDELSAGIADKTQQKKEDEIELVERKEEQESLKQKLADEEVLFAKQKAEYEAEAADLSKAIQGLKDAIKAMKDSKPASLLAIHETLVSALELGETMNLIKTPKRKVVSSLLQQSAGVDPASPEYKFHSQDIIDVCADLLTQYQATKKDLDDEWAKTKKASEDLQASLKKKMSANKKAMDGLELSIAKLAKEIAEHQTDLVEADAQLKDDQLYLKDLTARCEARANDYDQRSAMRGNELNALKEALTILKNDVKDATDVNERALFLQNTSIKPTTNSSPIIVVAVAKTAPPKPVAAAERAKLVPATRKSISFLQEVASSEKVRSLRGRLSIEARKQSALAVLQQAGDRLGSVALTTLAVRVTADPFKKVKGLIQKLIERLLEEAKNEATKKGFCDTEVGKAESDRDFRFQESMDLAVELTQLQAKRDALTEEIHTLKKEIQAEKKALNETTIERKADKKANEETLKTAKEGYERVNEAILILKVFYKQAAKAVFVQASPVDEDTKGPGFSGNYKGKQSGMKAVFALLETIASDFDRTIRKTEEAEHRAHREFVAYKQAAESSIAGKTTKKELDEQDLETTEITIETKTKDMQNAVDLLDSALKELEELKPTCMDTGMSYADRVAKREEEIKALKKALCILDEEGVEAECT